MLQIAPSEAVSVTRLEGDMEKLGNLYWLGYQDGIDYIGRISNYLGI